MRKIIGLFILFSLVFSVGAFGQEKLNFQDELYSFFKDDYKNKVSRVGVVEWRSFTYESGNGGIFGFYQGDQKLGFTNGFIDFNSDHYTQGIVPGRVMSLRKSDEFFQNFAVIWDNRVFMELDQNQKTTITRIVSGERTQISQQASDLVFYFHMFDFDKKQVNLVKFSKQDNKAEWAINFVNKFEKIYMFPFSISLDMKDGSREVYWFFYDGKSKKYLLVERSFLSYISKK